MDAHASALSGALAMCGRAGCDHGAAGHRTLLIQTRVAAASPSGWRDALVVAVTPDGWALLAPLDGDDAEAVAGIRVWHHDAVFAPHEPVALHRAAGLAAVGGVLRSVAIRG